MQRKPWKGFGDWLRHSNEAGIWREAFAVNDQMPAQVRLLTFSVITQAALAAYHEGLEP